MFPVHPGLTGGSMGGGLFDFLFPTASPETGPRMSGRVGGPQNMPAGGPRPMPVGYADPRYGQGVQTGIRDWSPYFTPGGHPFEGSGGRAFQVNRVSDRNWE